jgi:adenine/guanine phosphoribosyltransferase-like PRPP-binding protein
VLGKPILPLSLFVSTEHLPDVIQLHQVRPFEDSKQRPEAIDEIKRFTGKLRELTWLDVASAVSELAAQLLGRSVFPGSVGVRRLSVPYDPDLLIGSGTRGSICAGMLAVELRRERQCTWPILYNRRSGALKKMGLNKKQVAGKTVLVVEYMRNSGKTARALEKELNDMRAADVRFAAVGCQRGTSPYPQYCAGWDPREVKNPWLGDDDGHEW